VPLRQVPVIAPVLAALAPPRQPPRSHAPSKPKPEAKRAPAGGAPAPGERTLDAPAPPLPPRIEARLARGAAFVAAVRAREAAGVPVPPRAKARAALIARQQAAAEHLRNGEPVPMDLRTDIVRRRLDLAPPGVRARVLDRIERRRAAGLPIPPALDAATRGAPSLAPADAPPPPSPQG
jgi:hypothetical protein